MYSGTGTWWGGDVVGWGGALGGEAQDQAMQAVEEPGGGGCWGTSSFEILQMHLLNPAEGSKSVVSQKCHMVKCV